MQESRKSAPAGAPKRWSTKSLFSLDYLGIQIRPARLLCSRNLSAERSENYSLVASTKTFWQWVPSQTSAPDSSCPDPVRIHRAKWALVAKYKGLRNNLRNPLISLRSLTKY